MPTFGLRVDGPAGRRRRKRDRAVVELQLITRLKTLPAVLVDISQSGARVQLQGNLAVGEELLLKVLGFDLFGTVVWAERTGIIGVKFEDDVSEADVAKLMQKTRKCGLTLQGLEEGMAADHWKTGFAR